MSKPWYQSKTIWFNALAVLVFVAGSFGYADFTPDADIMAIVAAILNVVLRLVTSQSVTVKRQA